MNIAEVQAKTDEVLAAERQAFENWQAEIYGESHFKTGEMGEYTNTTVESQWQAWRARAVRAITGAVA